MKHRKHTALSRPDYGQFHRTEWAILGSPCSEIHSLVSSLLNALGTDFRLGYADADHQAPDMQETAPWLAAGAYKAFTDNIDFRSWEESSMPDTFRFRAAFRTCDAVFINGNHHLGKQQILIVDPKKYDSLQRKIDRLSNVSLILWHNRAEKVMPDFLQEHLPDWQNLPQFDLTDVAPIALWLRQQLTSTIAPLNGLVLAGGKSARMGSDKAQLVYTERPQAEVMLELLQPKCSEVFLSCREDQRENQDYPHLLVDSFTGLGPLGAILSAFRAKPDSAWLVVACDLPLVNSKALELLLQHRNPSRTATAFHNPETNWPDPLFTIWEPRAYPEILQFLAQGYSCPRKVLINSDIEEIRVQDSSFLTNVNTPEDLAKVKEKLAQG